MKGQAAVEMLTTVGIMLVLLVPLTLLLFTIANQNFEEVSKSQADISVKTIAHSMNNVYLGGSNTTKSILLNLPSNTKSLNISDGEVKMYLETSAGVTEASYPFISTLEDQAGYDFVKKGLFWLTINNQNNEVVLYG